MTKAKENDYPFYDRAKREKEETLIIRGEQKSIATFS